MESKGEEGKEAGEEQGVKSRLDESKYLPPIHRIKLPQVKTQTALIRWLFELGYPVKDISNGLNVRYQQVRNMVTTVPKRAAREDMPPLQIELLEMEDAVDMLLGAELERTFAEDRKRDKLAGKKAEAVIVDDVEGNEALDDENFGRE